MTQSGAAHAGTEISVLLARPFPHDEVLDVVALAGGRSNATYRVRLAKTGQVVLRIFTRSARESRREIELLARLSCRLAAPEVIAFDIRAESSAFVVYRYVEGVTFKEFKKTAGPQAIAEAAFATGAALAEIGKQPPVEATPFRVEPDCAGWGAPALPEFLAACSGDPIFRRRAGRKTASAMCGVVERWSAELAALGACRGLVHGDFSRSNVLVCNTSGTWRVAAILDWEFACGGSPFFDIGHFLRYERLRERSLEPHFSEGFAAGGGVLPDGWRRLARIVDLGAIAGGLTKAHLPQAAQAELLELLGDTLLTCPSP